MIELALQPAADIITALSWTDRFGGVAFPVEIPDEVDGQTIRKKYPAKQGLSADACYQQAGYLDLVPNTKLSNVLYFEVVNDLKEYEPSGSRAPSGRKMYLSGVVRLVYWLNLNKMGWNTIPDNYASKAGFQLMGVLGGRHQVNLGGNIPMQSTVITNMRAIERTPEIFGRYSYGSEINALMLHPFDYGAIEMTVQFEVAKSCIPQLLEGAAVDCIENPDAA